MSPTVIGVASTESYSFSYFSLKNTLNVASKIAPFIDADASIAGATNSTYPMGRPVGPATLPTSAPRPSPMDSR